jgi:hypothetical protein
MDTESQVVWPLIGGLMLIVALIGLIEADVLPGGLRQWLMLGVVLLGFGLLLAWEIRRGLLAQASNSSKPFNQRTNGTTVKSEDRPEV